MNKKEFLKFLMEKLEKKLKEDNISLNSIRKEKEKYPISLKSIYNVKNYIAGKENVLPIDVNTIKKLAELVNVNYVVDYIIK